DILTTSNANENDELNKIFGFPSTETSPIDKLSNARQFCRRLGVTYEELISILKTQFINPDSGLIPKVERLGVSFATLKARKDRTITDTDFDNRLADLAVPPDAAEYGGDIKAWVRNDDTYGRIMGLITLTVSPNIWAANHSYHEGDLVIPTTPDPQAPT